MTKADIFKLANEFIKNNGEGWSKASYPAYCASKALLNCYIRYALSKMISGN